MQFIYSFPYLASQIPDYFAAIFPEKTALVFNQKSYTYAGLQKQISTFASSLRRRGIQKGSKFLILLPNVPQFLFSLFGIMSTGLIAVPVYYHSKAAEIRKIMDIIHADGIVTTESKFETLKKNVPHFHPKLNILYRDEMEEDLPINFLGEEPLWDENPCLPIDLDPALIIFTSGSTGKPKGILLSHRNLVANTLANVQALQFHDRDRTLVQLPLTYLYALVHQVFSTFLTGGTIYLTDQFFLPHLFIQQLVEYNITWFAGTPPIYLSLLKYKEESQELELPEIRMITIGGGKIYPDVLKKLKPVFPEARIIITYGLTENSPRVASHVFNTQEADHSLVGRILPNVDVRITRQEDDQKGEIFIRGSSVMNGYYEGEHFRKVEIGSYIPTGDLGYLDTQRRLHLIGRRKNFINFNGYKVNPVEVEEVLIRHPRVRAVKVYAHKDEHQQESVKAEIEPIGTDSISVHELVKFCRLYLSNYKIPKIIQVKSKLEINSNMKY
jgi:long-chain acyl-CoA synthetase